MKILQAISHYVPAYRFGGPLQVAHALGRELVRCGHEVSVCCTNQADETPDLNVPLDTPVVVDGIRVFYEAVPQWRRWGYSSALRGRVEQLVSESDADGIARAIETWLSHPEQLTACRRNARAAAERDYSRRNSRHYVAAMRELLG